MESSDELAYQKDISASARFLSASPMAELMTRGCPHVSAIERAAGAIPPFRMRDPSSRTSGVDAPFHLGRPASRCLVDGPPL